ncbi:unnamed protein product [Hymenolepis diminuta]|uniref:Uncharacterized protein n=1 Tax=Hymenolepis diminuta TaxID=6216 RepID=A0A564YPW4_HYMDI|nr:unnamed protein product [Hymenolepis diminuta]VUZ49265.1 unnamed protein product [Hymenolepis diminuta]
MASMTVSDGICISLGRYFRSSIPRLYSQSSGFEVSQCVDKSVYLRPRNILEICLERYEGREEGRPLTPPPMHVTYASSRARIVGEKTIRFEKSPSEDNSPRQMPRYSRSPTKNRSSSPRHRVPPPIRRQSPTRHICKIMLLELSSYSVLINHSMDYLLLIDVLQLLAVH